MLTALEENETDEVERGMLLGRKADERPVRFWLEGKQYEVEAVLDQWYDPDGIFYKVRANDGNVYIIRQQTSTPEGTWDLVSFRRTNVER